MKGASVKKVILRFSSGNDPICHSQKFQPSQTPPSHFLPISPRFLTNIRCQYFSLNIWVVYNQLELDWCIFDQNWAKTRPLNFQIFQILNATDRRIVQWSRKNSTMRSDLCGGVVVIFSGIHPSSDKKHLSSLLSETLGWMNMRWYTQL